MAWETLGEAQAVFDRRTGETHFLADLPALILQALCERQLTRTALINELASAADIAIDENVSNRVLAALQFLERAELVESAASEYA